MNPPGLNPSYNPAIPNANTSQGQQVADLQSYLSQAPNMIQNPTLALQQGAGQIQQQIANAPGQQLLDTGTLSQLGQLPQISQGMTNIAQQGQNALNTPGVPLGSNYMAPAFQPGGSGQATQYSDMPNYAGDPALGVPALPTPTLPVMTPQSLAAAPGGFTDPALGVQAATSNSSARAGVMNLLSSLYGANQGVVGQGIQNDAAFQQANIQSQEFGLNFMSSILPYLMLSGAGGGQGTSSASANPLASLGIGSPAGATPQAGVSAGLNPANVNSGTSQGGGVYGTSITPQQYQKLPALEQDRIQTLGQQQQYLTMLQNPFLSQYASTQLGALENSWKARHGNLPLSPTISTDLANQASSIDRINTALTYLQKLPASSFGAAGGNLQQFLYNNGMSSLMDNNTVGFLQQLGYLKASGDKGLAGVRGAASTQFMNKLGSTFGSITLSKPQVQTTLLELQKQMMGVANAQAQQDGYSSFQNAIQNSGGQLNVTGY